MRFVHWCVAAALLANGAVFYWQSQQKARDALPPPAQGMGRLVLLSEMETADTDIATTDTGSGAAAVDVAADAESGALEVQTNDMPDDTATPVEAVLSDTDTAAAAAPASEAGLADTAPVPEAPRCWWLGPVKDDRLSEELSAQFAAAAISMDLVLRTVEADPDHWVYLSTTGSQAEVRNLSRDLREAGFDNFPITTGPLAGSLSLGLFRSGEGARELRGDLQGQGYDAQIFQRPRYRDEAWVALDDAGRQALGWPGETGLVPGFESLFLEEDSCSQ